MPQNVLMKMSKLPNPAQPPTIMQANGLARAPQNVLMKMSKLPHPAQPPAIIQARWLVRVPQTRAHENEQAAQSCPTSHHNVS